MAVVSRTCFFLLFFASVVLKQLVKLCPRQIRHVGVRGRMLLVRGGLSTSVKCARRRVSLVHCPIASAHPMSHGHNHDGITHLPHTHNFSMVRQLTILGQGGGMFHHYSPRAAAAALTSTAQLEVRAHVGIVTKGDISSSGPRSSTRTVSACESEGKWGLAKDCEQHTHTHTPQCHKRLAEAVAAVSGIHQQTTNDINLSDTCQSCFDLFMCVLRVLKKKASQTMPTHTALSLFIAILVQTWIFGSAGHVVREGGQCDPRSARMSCLMGCLRCWESFEGYKMAACCWDCRTSQADIIDDGPTICSEKYIKARKRYY